MKIENIYEMLNEKPVEELVEILGIIGSIIQRKGYDAGYESGMSERVKRKETPQAKRDRIVERAKKDIETLQQTGKIRTIRGIDGLFHTFYPNEYDYVDFVINKQNRTVVALIKRNFDDVVWAKGITKAHPNDCFNSAIGKAIALRRALGLEVPSEYLNAPQPTEVRVGDVVYDEYYEMSGKVYAINPEYRTYGKDSGHYFGKGKGWLTYIDPNDYERRIKKTYVKIIDDSRE